MSESGRDAVCAGPPDRRAVGADRIAHRSSHNALLRWRSDGEAGSLDAVVLSTARPAYHAIAAMELAAAMGSELVILCSRRANPREVAGLACEVPGLRATVVDLNGYRNRRLAALSTNSVPAIAPIRLGDLSLKRNIGLLLGLQAGWGTLFFLDDDIRSIRPKLVRRAVAGLETCDAVGMVVREFTDNSVVCHANRLGGARQGVFVSGSALLVNPAANHSFFPAIYNEDWFFLHDLLAAGRVGAVGCVTQLAFDPFADPARAAGEEFGDVLAEGLMTLLHAGRSPTDADAFFWACFLEARREFIASAARGLSSSTTVPETTACALRALTAAERARARITPQQLVDFLDRWRDDAGRWRDLTAGLCRGVPLSDALASVGLAGRAVATASPGEEVSARSVRSAH